MAEKLITEINQWDSMSPVSSMLPYKNWKEKRWEVKSLFFFYENWQPKTTHSMPKSESNPKPKSFEIKVKRTWASLE